MSRILVVDDHAVTREPLARLLRYEGYETVSAANGAEALLAMYDQPADLVLLDLMMPRMDGIEFLTALRSEPRFGQTPVLLMTAVPESSRLDRARALSGIAVIQKARFELPDLLARIRGTLAAPQLPQRDGAEPAAAALAAAAARSVRDVPPEIRTGHLPAEACVAAPV